MDNELKNIQDIFKDKNVFRFFDAHKQIVDKISLNLYIDLSTKQYMSTRNIYTILTFIKTFNKITCFRENTINNFIKNKFIKDII